jgi:DNA-binding transcriptional ArsR family regulator
MAAHPDALFKVLSDPTRRAVFERLSRDGELTVHALTEDADVSQPAISKHLALLKGVGLVRDRRCGRETYYAAEPKGLGPLMDWMKVYGIFWLERFDRLEQLLQRMDQ